jgi:hypothetical protein
MKTGCLLRAKNVKMSLGELSVWSLFQLPILLAVKYYTENAEFGLYNALNYSWCGLLEG